MSRLTRGTSDAQFRARQLALTLLQLPHLSERAIARQTGLCRQAVHDLKRTLFGAHKRPQRVAGASWGNQWGSKPKRSNRSDKQP